MILQSHCFPPWLQSASTVEQLLCVHRQRGPTAMLSASSDPSSAGAAHLLPSVRGLLEASLLLAHRHQDPLTSALWPAASPPPCPPSHRLHLRSKTQSTYHKSIPKQVLDGWSQTSLQHFSKDKCLIGQASKHAQIHPSESSQAAARCTPCT